MPSSNPDETVLFVNPKNQTAPQVPSAAPVIATPLTTPVNPQPPITTQPVFNSPIQDQLNPQPSVEPPIEQQATAVETSQPIQTPNQTVDPSEGTTTNASAAPTEDAAPATLASTLQTPLQETQTLHQPVALLLVRLVFFGLAYYFTLWAMQKIFGFLVVNFPELIPSFVAPSFFDSKIFIWGTIIFIFIAIGITLRWWSIYFVISALEVVVHSGIVIKQAQVLKRLGISIRQIEFKRTILGMIFKYVTIEIGSEILGGISITIADNQASLDTITSALQPGETKQTKKLF